MGTIPSCLRRGEVMAKIDRLLVVVDVILIGVFSYWAITSEGWMSIVMGIFAELFLLLFVLRHRRTFSDKRSN